MGRAPCCAKVGLHRGPWTPREDALLTKYIQAHGEGQWRSLPKRAGLLRCGKSCRLRWMNYLRPDIKRGNITAEEDDLIIRMHSLLGNRWSLIAGRLPGRTDNEIKNYWNTHLSKKLRNQATDPNKLTEETEKKKDKKKKKKNKQSGKNKGAKAESEKTLVYLPKAIRVAALSSTTFTLVSNSVNSASTSQEKEGKEDWGLGEDRDNGVFGFIGEDRDTVNGSDGECHSGLPTLEMLYEEYLQLLKAEDNTHALDSFAQSLLA